MKERISHTRRLGFSIIELMVVIGILAILIAALLPFLGGSTDSADCVKCKNNMKALAMAMISCAQADDVYGHFPSAGYYRELRVSTDGPYYHPIMPWISNKGDFSRLKSTQKTVYAGSVAHFTDSEEDCREVVEHGAIWRAANASFGIYRCPVHSREFEKKNKRPPGWSFMMNQTFGYNDTPSEPKGFCGKSIHSSIGGRGHDKVLMFAEVQGVDVEVKTGKGKISLEAVKSGDKADAVLVYKDEDMGFNHKIGKNKYGGNVAFADGHVDTITMPMDKSYIRDLTRYLCQGVDVPHDGSKYKPANADN